MILGTFQKKSTKHLSKKHNKSMHADCKKRRDFRYATATPRFAAGDASRYVFKLTTQKGNTYVQTIANYNNYWFDFNAFRM